MDLPKNKQSQPSSLVEQNGISSEQLESQAVETKINIESLLQGEVKQTPSLLESMTEDLNSGAIKANTSMLDPGKSMSITDVVQMPTAAQTALVEKEVQNKISGNNDKIGLNMLEQAAKDAAEADPYGDNFKPSLSGTGFRVNLQNEDGNGYVGTI